MVDRNRGSMYPHNISNMDNMWQRLGSIIREELNCDIRNRTFGSGLCRQLVQRVIDQLDLAGTLGLDVWC